VSRHKGWAITLSVLGVLVLLGIAGALAGSPKTAPTATTSTPPSPSPTRTTPPAATLTAEQSKFVSALRAHLLAKNLVNTSTDAQLASVGERVCSARQSGASQAKVVKAAAGAPGTFRLSGKKFVRLAENDLCPQYIPKPPVVLLRLSGNGIQNSGPVTVTQSSLTVHYSYDCSGFGTSGNFIADFETADQSSLSSDDQSIANALGSGGSATTTIYPQDTGSEYHLAVNSECNWSVTISAPSS
jgi:Protein of unknown function (DUF732)